MSQASGSGQATSSGTGQESDIATLRKHVEGVYQFLSEKIEAQNAHIIAQGETLKNMMKEVGNVPLQFPGPEIHPGEGEDDEVCLCGNILMADALYCRKCGRKRPDPFIEEANEEEPEVKLPESLKDDDDQKSLATSKSTLTNVAKGFGKSKSFQNELARAEASATGSHWSSSMTSRIGDRMLHFDRLRDLTRSREFLITFAIIVVLNAVFTAIIADFSCRGVVDAYMRTRRVSDATEDSSGPKESLDWELPSWPLYIDIAFAAIFAIEIAMRIIGEEVMFFIGHDWFWNNADFVLFIVAVLELALLFVDVDMSVIRIFRLTRVGRTVRMIRLLKYSRELRVMVVSVGHSLLPLLWVSLFLAILLSVFAVVFLLACTNYMEIAGPLEGAGSDAENTDIVETITTFFNSFPVAVVSLFMSVTGGVNWWQFNQPLSNIHPALGVLYLFFILFVVLAVLNTVTAIFVESVQALAQTDKDLVTQKQQEQIAKYIGELREVFISLDEDGSGTLTLEEFQARADDPQVIAYFEALEIDAMKATDFFKLFDIDGSGELEIEEFVAGCMRIKGGAKAVDIETIMHENQKLMTKFKEFFDRSARGFARIERMVQAAYQHMFAKFSETDAALLRFQETQMAIEEKVAGSAAGAGMFSYIWSNTRSSTSAANPTAANFTAI